MKFTIWYDLPNALMNLCQDIITPKDAQSVKYLSKVSKSLQSQFEEISSEIAMMSSSLSKSEVAQIKNKLSKINKERIGWLCRCIKQSIQLISQFVFYLQSNTMLLSGSQGGDKETWVQIKLLNRILRLIIINSKETIGNHCNGKEKSFFTMIQIYAEKTQIKVYQLSNDLAKRVITENALNLSGDNFEGEKKWTTPQIGDNKKTEVDSI